MKRGDIVIAADSNAGDYGGKPRPFIILQSDAFAELDSVTVCPLTSIEAASLTRVAIKPNERNGLRAISWAATDKIITVRRGRLGKTIGKLSEAEMTPISAAIMVFLELAG